MYIKTAHEHFAQQLGPGSDLALRSKQALGKAALANSDRAGAIVFLREALGASREQRGYLTAKTMEIQFHLCQLLSEENTPVRE